MTNESLYLAIDQGGGSSRALVFTATGRLMAKAQRSVDVDHPRLGWVEQNPTELLDSVLAVIDDVRLQLGSDVTRLRAAGMATQRSNVVCWQHSNGKALSAAISWQDRRAYRWMQSFDAYATQVRNKTGLRLSPHYGVSKIKWCLDNLQTTIAANNLNDLICGPLASYLAFNMVESSVPLVDPANASRTLLWNINSGDWDEELLALFSIPRAYLPRCTDTWAQFGDIKIGSNKIPLNVVTGDQSAALYAYGNPEPDNVYINMGTGVFIQFPTSQQMIDVPGLLCSVSYQDSHMSNYVIEATINGAANALTEVEDALGISGAEAEQKFGQWTQRFVNPPLFLNGVAGLAAPYWVPDFKSHFIGSGTPEEKIIAVAESILFLIRVNIELLQQHIKSRLNIVVTGGLSKSNILCQKLANLLKAPVFRPDEAEATARGVAFLTAGMPKDWIKISQGTRFDVQSDPDLLKRFDLWYTELQTELQNYK